MGLVRQNKVEHVMVHHSATSVVSPQVLMNNSMSWMNSIQRGYWRQRGYIADYHFYINPDGTITAGQPLNMECFHSGWTVYNRNSIAICMIGKIHEYAPPEAQYQALVKLTKRLFKNFKINSALRHSDVTNTNCPGTYFDWRRFTMDIQPKTYIFNVQGDIYNAEVRDSRGNLIETVKLDFHPMVAKGRVMIPISALRAMGMEVGWNAHTKQASVKV